MFRSFMRLARQGCRLVMRAAQVLVAQMQAAWRRHLEQVSRNPGYAAATAALVAGALGLMPGHDVLTAVLAGVFGVFVRGAQEAGGAIRPTINRYESDLY